jgi:hypothetical protein
MFGRRTVLTLMTIGTLAGAPALVAQAPAHAHPLRATTAWRYRGDHWVGRRVWLERREVHRLRRCEHRRHVARGHVARRQRSRQWDGII